MKSIKKVEQPTHSWKSYAVRVIHEYESYGDARLKLRQAEETSALDTETDEVATMKSREKRKKILTDEDDDEAIQPEGVVPLKKVKKTSPDSFQATTLPVVPTSLQCQPVVGNTDLTTQNFDQCDQSNELTQNDNDIESAQLDVEPSETGAVKRNRLCSKATRDDIETTVKLWLRYAKDRAGGRSCRLTSKKRNRPVVAGESGDSASE
jgi:hypothetical protein